MKKSLMLIFAVAAILVGWSCGGNSQEKTDSQQSAYNDGRTSDDMQRTITDTVAVLYNVHEYLRLQKEEKLDSALDMLYIPSGDTVIHIDEKRRAEILGMMKQFPVLDYSIDRVNLYNEDDSEVRYTIEYFKKEEGDPRPNTMQCVLAPHRVGYYWYLTVPVETRDVAAVEAPVE